MPAIITHDSFGQDLYKRLYAYIGGTKDEYDAFLLGNQGPDPLFYSVLVPKLRKFHHLGSTMHSKKPNELLLAMRQSLSLLDEKEYPIGRAYALGFICHYVLDSSMHPFIYFNEYRLCDAGIEGLSREDGNEVHAVIESELDEMVLFVKRERTVADFNPKTEILRGSDFVLSVISKMHVYAAITVYGLYIPPDMFARALKSFRLMEGIFRSKSGLKRTALGWVEERFRRYSFIRSMSPRALEITSSQFDNQEHEPWENPFTDEVSRNGFWDIYNQSLGVAEAAIEAMDSDDFDLDAARGITHDLDFSGEPTVALLFMEDEA